MRINRVSHERVLVMSKDGTWREMNEQIAKGVALMPCSALVSSEGLYDVKSDKIHFATSALREFGLRYWRVYDAQEKSGGPER